VVEGERVVDGWVVDGGCEVAGAMTVVGGVPDIIPKGSHTRLIGLHIVSKT